MKPTVENVLAVFNHASLSNYNDGLSWYNDAHNFARSLEPGNVERASAIVAVLSPQVSWSANVTLALRAYENMSGDGLGFQDKVRKINRLFAGESPDSVIGGQKVVSFYSTILAPSNPDSIPTIDRHAFDIAVGMKTEDKVKNILSRKGVYMAFADVYRTAASIVGIGAPQIQAVTWLRWKDMHDIKV